MSNVRYRFGPFSLDLSRACVSRDGAEVSLRPKSFALLEYLVTHAGHLVAKDELMCALWPDVVVTDDSLTRCISEVRAALGDSGQRIIKTVSKRGYVFAEPVTVAGAESPFSDAAVPAALPLPPVSPPAQVPASAPAGLTRRAGGRSFSTRTTSAVVISLALLAVALGYAAMRSRQSVPPRLTLVVLPFISYGAEQKAGYLADVLTEDLTAAMSRLHGSTVIATSSAFTYRNKSIDLRQVAVELKVRYALQGSLLTQGDRVRINAELMDTGDGKSLWSDQFDVRQADFTKLQDQIVSRLASVLGTELVAAVSTRSIDPANGPPGADDLAMRCEAAAHVKQGESGVPSYELCEQALRLDPDNVRALVTLAFYHGIHVERVQSPNPQDDLLRARRWVERALNLAPVYYAAHCTHAVVLAQEHRVHEAIAAAERCRSLNPSSALAYRLLSTFNFFLADPVPALAFVDRAIELSPRDPQLTEFYLFKGWSYFLMGKDAETLVWVRQANAAAPDYPSVLAPLISLLALSGHQEEASVLLARYLALPQTKTRTLRQWELMPDDNPGFRNFAERFKSGLRKAGMPEQ